MQRTGLVVGNGIVGQALYKILKKVHRTYIRDIDPIDMPATIDVLNIAFPWTPGFEEFVKIYKQEYCPRLTIIHSSVPPGTSRRLNAVHSPVHGRHKSKGGLVRGILTFPKFVGGVDEYEVAEAVAYLKAAKIKTQIVDNPETSEISKIGCTTYTALSAVWVREFKRMCDETGANFHQAYTVWGKHYNDGYKKQGDSKFQRPILDYEPGPLRGHCCAENCALMPTEPVLKFVMERNEAYKKNAGSL